MRAEFASIIDTLKRPSVDEILQQLIFPYDFFHPTVKRIDINFFPAYSISPLGRLDIFPKVSLLLRVTAYVRAQSVNLGKIPLSRISHLAQNYEIY